MKLAYLKKSIYSLCPDLASISRTANHRYIDCLSAIDDPTPGIKALSKISDSVEEREHRYRGFNLFDDEDQTLFEVLCRGEFFIHGFRNRSLREHLDHFRPSQVSRLLKRLRLHGIIRSDTPTSTTCPSSDDTSPSQGSPSRTSSSSQSLLPTLLLTEPTNSCFPAINRPAYGLPRPEFPQSPHRRPFVADIHHSP